MKQRQKWLTMLAAVVSLGASLGLVAGCAAQPPPTATPAAVFEQNGFTVQGDFLRFFEKYGGQASLGRPISAEMDDGGWRVQYFEKGRLELHPENDPAYRITVGWLGDLLQRRQPPLPPGSVPPVTAPNTRYFAATGHTVSGDFLAFFETAGGSVRFGLPISEPFLLNGQLTQDFQSARFFWTPTGSTPVTLEDIGRAHLATITPKK